MSNSKSYKDEWEDFSPINGGGQGTTIKATNKSNKELTAAIKVLNRQKDKDRRARMHRESTALETLDHAGIPHFIDSNTSYFKEEEYNLFIATEFIPGPTLSEVDFSKYSLEDRFRLFQAILETLNYCHKRGIIHRDIKPDNIILKNGDIANPVLVDFGLSFNTNARDDDNLTPSGEQLGNRFLILPEQKVGEAGKREDKSDIACAVGLFFFFITQSFPTIPIDEHNRKPHQREKEKAIIDTIPKHQRDIINHIFDVGFEQLIDRRWQSVQSLLDQLVFLESAKPESEDHKPDNVTVIKARTEKHDYQDRKSLHKIFSDIDKQARATLSEMRKELGNDWGTTQSGGIHGDAYKNMLAPHNAILQYSGKTVIHSFATGNELVIQLIEGKNGKEVFRIPIIGEIDLSQFAIVLKEHYLKQINDTFYGEA